MAKAKKRYYEIAPGWPGGRYNRVPLYTDDGVHLLTASRSFEYLENYYQKKVPTGGRLETKPRQIPDLIEGGGEEPIVTSTIKAVIEAVAPGEAEFRPFRLRWQDDSPVPGNWYLCNVLNRIDCFDFAFLRREHPPVRTKRRNGEAMTPEEIWLSEGGGNVLGNRPNYIDPETIGTHHIWRPRFHARTIFVTGDLLKALRDGGAKGLSVDRLGTRDDPYAGRNPPYGHPPPPPQPQT